MELIFLLGLVSSPLILFFVGIVLEELDNRNH